jgi:hypothetical protein
MREWLHEFFPQDASVRTDVVLVQLAASFGFGCLVAAIYYFTHRRTSSSSSSGMMATLVLLTMLICVVTIVIGNNSARAFSLVGALAIIRFRTIVEDTRDTAFVIFAVAEGMAVGSGYVTLPLVLAPLIAVAAYLFRHRETAVSDLDHTLVIRLGVGQDPQSRLQNAFTKHLDGMRLLAVTTARQGAAMEYQYAVRLHQEHSAVALVAELNGLEGVQNVELRRT